MKILRYMGKTNVLGKRSGGLALFLALLLALVFIPRANATVVNFDSLPAWVAADGMSSGSVSGAPLAAYLGSYGITYTETGTLAVGAEYYVRASSPHNMLTVVAPTGSSVGTFTLYFDHPVESLSFVKPGANPVWVAPWTATAYSGSTVVGSASRFGERNPVQETIAFAGSGIDHLTITSDHHGFYGTLVWIDDLSFRPVPTPEPGTMMLVGSGLVGLVSYGRRRFKK